DGAERIMAQPDWEEQVLRRSNVEKIFLTNDFDDSLEGFDTSRYVPCLRTDDLTFHLDKPEVRKRLTKVTGIEVGDPNSLGQAITRLFEHFIQKGAKACAISLPPSFFPRLLSDEWVNSGIAMIVSDSSRPGVAQKTASIDISTHVFW